EMDASLGGVPDDAGDGVFKHLSDHQTSVEQHALAYGQVAEAVAGRTDIPALTAALPACTQATEACGSAFVESVGQRLFRRPLDDREMQAMLGVYRAAIAESADHLEAARWTLMALLPSPQFLFHLEDE